MEIHKKLKNITSPLLKNMPHLQKSFAKTFLLQYIPKDEVEKYHAFFYVRWEGFFFSVPGTQQLHFIKPTWQRQAMYKSLTQLMLVHFRHILSLYLYIEH